MKGYDEKTNYRNYREISHLKFMSHMGDQRKWRARGKGNLLSR
jgi:hypothetical protein